MLPTGALRAEKLRAEKFSSKWLGELSACSAWVAGDAAALEQYLAPDYALIVSAAPTQHLDRAHWLGIACARYKAAEFEYRDIQVRHLGDGIAAMSSIANFKAEIDRLPGNGPLFLVDVWRQMDGRWRVCTATAQIPRKPRRPLPL